jgi:hypothetical protein
MTTLSEEDKGILALAHLNKVLPKTEVLKKWRVGRLNIQYHWRSKKNFMGRFGGGWNWELGFQASGRTVILNCLVFTLRFDTYGKPEAKP